MTTPLWIGGVIASAVLGLLLGWWLERLRLKRAKADAETEAARIRQAAEADSERIRKAAELAGKEEAYRARQDWEREEDRRREEMDRAERRMEERLSALDRKYDLLDEKEKAVSQREQEIEQLVLLVVAEGAQLDQELDPGLVAHRGGPEQIANVEDIYPADLEVMLE